MSTDQIRYDLLAQDALRSVVRRVLADAAKNGLPGDHHFYISFDTRDPGARISSRLMAQYPEEMTIVLQHQFWDLAVHEHAFEVSLSFNGISERLQIPFTAIKGFFDPSVQFGLQFQSEADGSGEQPAAPAAPPPKSQERRIEQDIRAKGARKAEPTGPAADAADAAEGPAGETAPPPQPAAEVVRLDRYRKK